MEIKLLTKYIEKEIFLFINPSSGNKVGEKLLSSNIDKAHFKLPLAEYKVQHHLKQLRATVHFIDLKTNLQKGFLQLKQSIQKEKNLILIVCGGDGTIMWVASQFKRFQINPKRAPIGVIPLGTGNDLSRWLGWGDEQKYLIQDNYEKLKDLLVKFSFAAQENLDIWDIRAETFDYGYFERIVAKEKHKLNGTVFQMSFCSYFSFGIDGKVGYSFDKHRTNSRFGNLLTYACVSCCVNQTKTPFIQQLVSQMRILTADMRQSIHEKSRGMVTKKFTIEMDIGDEQIGQHKKEKLFDNNDDGVKIIFKTQLDDILQSSQRNKKFSEKNQSDYHGDEKSTKSINTFYHSKKMLNNLYANILALNISSYAGGLHDIWKNAKDGINNEQQIREFKQPSASDQQLQFVSFKSAAGIIFQRIAPGNASKITQGKGPFFIEFNENKEHKRYCTYLQFDGQFVRFNNPKNLLIQHSKMIKGGQIRVLRNVMEKEEQRSFLII